MHLNLKDDETVALVTEVANRLGLTKTGAVRELARDRLAKLDQVEASDVEERTRRALQWLQRDVWPHTATAEPLTKEQEEELLGYDEMLR